MTPVIIFILYIAVALAQVPGPQTVLDHAGYSKLRPCAQGCFYYKGQYTSDKLGLSLRCSITTILLSKVAENDCFCRSDLQISAHLSLSSCVLKSCQSNSNDMTSAWSVYDSYCTANGYFVGSGAESVPTAQDGNGPVATDPAAPGGGNTRGAGIPVATAKPSSAYRAIPCGTTSLPGLIMIFTYFNIF
jgi:hypothetical protein